MENNIQEEIQKYISQGKSFKEALNAAYNGIPKLQQGGTDTPYKLPVYLGATQEKCKGAGCSEIATNITAGLLNVDRNTLSPQDAWYKKEAVIRQGGHEIWDSTKTDYSGVRVGDFVSLDRYGDYHKQDKSKISGYSLKNNEGNEHVGTVVGVNENGKIMVKHGSAEGTMYTQPIDEINLPEFNFSYKPLSIYRAKIAENKDIDRNDKNYKNLIPNKPISIKGGSENENKFISSVNKSMSLQQRNTDLSPQEIKNLNSLSFGIFHNETEAGGSNTPIGGKMIISDIAHKLGRRNSPSLSDVQIKYDDLYKNADGSITKSGALMDKLNVSKTGLEAPLAHRDNYDDEVNSVFALLSTRLQNIKNNKEKYKYDEQNNTVYNNIPIEQLLVESYKNPSVINNPQVLEKNHKYSDNALKYARNINSGIYKEQYEPLPKKAIPKLSVAELIAEKKQKDDDFKSIVSKNFTESTRTITPKFQEGNTWLPQMARVRQEQANKPFPKLTVKELIAEKKLKDAQIKTEVNTQRVDNTRVNINNKPELISKTARNKSDDEIAYDRNINIQKSIRAQDTSYTQENWREQLAAETAATADKFRFSNKPNVFDDYINPAVWIGGMASALGQAPLQAEQQDSYMPYINSIGAPLFVGAITGALGGAQTNSQFLNNIVNPLAGTGDLVNHLGSKYLPNAHRINPFAFKTNPNKFYRQVDNMTYDEGLESGLIRGKQDINTPDGEAMKFFGDEAYYNKGEFYYKNKQQYPYVFEANLPEENFIPKVNGRTNKYTTENTNVRVSKNPISINDPNITTYRQDWLQGYKQIEVPKAQTAPISDLPNTIHKQGGKIEFTENEKAFLKELKQQQTNGL